MNRHEQQARGLPRRILLATDMTSRCDRATERALTLSQDWNASIIVLHVLDPDLATASSSPALLANWHQRLQDHVKTYFVTGAEDVLTLVEQGEAAEVITRVARTQKCDLIVTGFTSLVGLEHFLVDNTADRILLMSATPLLIGRLRARSNYHKILIAIDFSEASRHALDLATAWFPQAALTLFHAYDTPFSTFVSHEDWQKDYREAAILDYADFVARCGGEASSLPIVFEAGSPAPVLAHYVTKNEVDLVVAAQSPSDLLKRLFGTTTRTFEDDIPCDLLIVPMG
ncbi:universal stress protein [Beijerinckia indica]|uniref:UspA domain protein n=1 Tax=Beijerinckia indica subsp. indica (strain ATCC 9039 / DSM 1715 / NCIMB 8712) TaxID=395963 RepID=B2IDP7_BEII9|nr:universal stress protein [Beijerinckia indica]ACB95483.1 UspA domain protein [Beijerinckia indica subsp. indica ATCC 9039]